MRFEISQTFRNAAAAVDQTYVDPALYPTLVGLPNLGDITVVSHRRDANTAQMSIHCTFVRQFSPAVAAAIDPSKLSWVQESVHDLVAATTTFRFLPDNYADRFSASGTTRMSDTPSGSLRKLTGDVKVRAPLVGGRVEKAIVEGLEEYLLAEAELVDRFIEG